MVTTWRSILQSVGLDRKLLHTDFKQQILGILNAFTWLAWGLNVLRIYGLKAGHAWFCIMCVSVACILMLFELLDFPPWFWMFDALSLWHLGTASLPLVWSR